MMKKSVRAAAAVIAACLSLVLGGCSFTSITEEMVDFVTGTTGVKDEANITVGSEGLAAGKVVDESLEAPVFTTDLDGSESVLVGKPVTIEACAEVSDGGSVTYQWFSNNVRSNGGGTRIQGVTEAFYTPETSEPGTAYYYVVAINNHDDHINLSASAPFEVRVWSEGKWEQDIDERGFRYMTGNDLYPASTVMEIGGAEYSLDENGFAVNAEGRYINPLDNNSIVKTAEEEKAEKEAADRAAAEEAAIKAVKGESAVTEDGEAVPEEEAPAENTEGTEEDIPEETMEEAAQNE